MNKKVVLGCLGAVVVVGVAGALLLFFFVIKPIAEISGDIEDVAMVPEMNADILNHDPFTPPEDGVLTGEQVESFVRVQTTMRNGSGAAYPELDARSEKVRRMFSEGEEDEIGFREALATVRGLGEIMPSVKQVQVNALNREGLSLAEYRWIRECFYFALGQPNADVYIEDIAEEILAKKGNLGGVRIDSLPTRIVPEANVELTRAYRDSLDSWEPFLVFGF